MSALAAHAATVVFLFLYFWVVLITALDMSPLYAAFPYRHFVITVLAFLLALVPGKDWRLKVGLLLILVFWFSVLPRISWHEESHFFINAGTLRKGMTVAEVQQRMDRFSGYSSDDGRELYFQPTPSSRGLCVVQVRNGKVRQVVTRRD